MDATATPTSPAVRQVPPPDAARVLSRLQRIDYADAFLLETGALDQRHADAWARGVLCDAPLETRSRLLTGWTGLGLKLRPGGSLLGWTVRRRAPDVLLLGADSRIGMPAELLFKREDTGLLFCTFVQQDNAVARAAWAAVEPIHVPTVRSLLLGAAGRLAR